MTLSYIVTCGGGDAGDGGDDVVPEAAEPGEERHQQPEARPAAHPVVEHEGGHLLLSPTVLVLN